MIDLLLYTLVGVLLGCLAGLIPGLHSSNLSLLLTSFGLATSQYSLVFLIIGIEVSYAFFQFLSPILFGISDDLAALSIDDDHYFVIKNLVDRAVKIIATGGVVGVLISFPLIFFSQKIYPLVYGSIKPLVGWLLLIVCIYIFWTEKTWKKKFFAVIIFLVSGIFGLIIKNSGFIPDTYLFLPVFLGLFGFSSIIARKPKATEIIYEIPAKQKIRISFTSFLSSLFASLIPGVKRSQAAAIALETGKIGQSEERLFALSVVSLSCMMLSILVLDSTGSVRSTLAYEINDIIGEMYFNKTLLLIGCLALAASLSSILMLLSANPLNKILSKVDKKYLKIFGFGMGLILIIYFTGWKGLLLAFTATCIGILAILLRIRSTYLMGVLLLPSIIVMLM